MRQLLNQNMLLLLEMIACTGGIYKGIYDVVGPVDSEIPVDLKIPGNPRTPSEIIPSLLQFMQSFQKR